MTSFEDIKDEFEPYKNILVTNTFLKNLFGNHNILEFFFNYKGNIDESIDTLYKIISAGDDNLNSKVHLPSIPYLAEDMYSEIKTLKRGIDFIGSFLRPIFILFRPTINKVINARLYRFKNPGIQGNLNLQENNIFNNAKITLRVKPYERKSYGRIYSLESLVRITPYNNYALKFLDDAKKRDFYLSRLNKALEGKVPENPGFSDFLPKSS